MSTSMGKRVGQRSEEVIAITWATNGGGLTLVAIVRLFVSPPTHTQIRVEILSHSMLVFEARALGRSSGHEVEPS